MSSSPDAAHDWPLLRLPIPPAADDEQTVQLTQTAVEAGALGAAHEGPSLVIYLPRPIDEARLLAVRQAVAAQADALGWPPVHFEAGTLADAPWATMWKADFKTLPIGRRLLVRPDWEQGSDPPAPWSDRLTLWIQPGQGFGTGRHETTRLALLMLEEYLAPGDAVLDFGSGSGVLALAAWRLGAGRVTAVECDPDANINARDNIAINGAEGTIALVESADPADAPGPYDLIVCNILPQHALPRLAALAKSLAGQNPRLIYTGFLADQIPEVEAALNRAGLKPVKQQTEGEWCGFAARLA
jgi:ribosomal protein L11 methyltransferase